MQILRFAQNDKSSGGNNLNNINSAESKPQTLMGQILRFAQNDKISGANNLNNTNSEQSKPFKP